MIPQTQTGLHLHHTALKYKSKTLFGSFFFRTTAYELFLHGAILNDIHYDMKFTEKLRRSLEKDTGSRLKNETNYNRMFRFVKGFF